MPTPSIEEIPETQQFIFIPPPASQQEIRYGKRKVDNEPTVKDNPNPKKKAVTDMSFISGRAEINPKNTSVRDSENEEAITIETLKVKIQTLEERMKKNEDVITTLFQGIDILGQRMTRAEDLTQQHDRKHLGALTSLRGDLNRTDGHVLRLLSERDRINNAHIQALNSFIRPSETA